MRITRYGSILGESEVESSRGAIVFLPYSSYGCNNGRDSSKIELEGLECAIRTQCIENSQ